MIGGVCRVWGWGRWRGAGGGCALGAGLVGAWFQVVKGGTVVEATVAWLTDQCDVGSIERGKLG